MRWKDGKSLEAFTGTGVRLEFHLFQVLVYAVVWYSEVQYVDELLELL